jgi:hypothetical protein
MKQKWKDGFKVEYAQFPFAVCDIAYIIEFDVYLL